jgi:3-oxoacyl-[acyl-carrier protein] reductase
MERCFGHARLTLIGEGVDEIQHNASAPLRTSPEQSEREVPIVGLLEGKVAVVTGGAQGIGLAIARLFVTEGARVVIGDLDPETNDKAVAELGGGSVARGVVCDVTNADQVHALVSAAVDAFGSFHVMVNNAGITRDATMRKMTEEQFDQVINVHLKGCWNGTRLAAAWFREHGGGAIINISSLSGKAGMVGQTNYSAAKAGIVGLSKAAAKEVAHLGVRVNVVQPGLIRSAMTEAMPQQAWDQKMGEIPMGRAGEVEEVAKVVLFYASDLSSYMTGTVAEVTGGRLM